MAKISEWPKVRRYDRQMGPRDVRGINPGMKSGTRGSLCFWKKETMAKTWLYEPLAVHCILSAERSLLVTHGQLKAFKAPHFGASSLGLHTSHGIFEISAHVQPAEFRTWTELDPMLNMTRTPDLKPSSTRKRARAYPFSVILILAI